MWAYQTDVEELHGEVERRAGLLLLTRDGAKAGQVGGREGGARQGSGCRECAGASAEEAPVPG